jgi:putative pyrroloquinoline-quinone binding quinoprotein
MRCEEADVRPVRGKRLVVGACVSALCAAGLQAPDPARATSVAGELWSARYGRQFSDQAHAVVTSPDGASVFVTGWSNGGGTNDDYATLAYDAATGSVLWSQRYNGPNDGSDQANALAVSPDGALVYVTGLSDSSATNDDYATLAYDAHDGRRLWLRRYNGLGNDTDIAQAMVVSPDGSRVYVTGMSDGGALGFDFATVAYDTVSGTQLWIRRLNGQTNDSDQAYAIGLSPDGTKLFVTGSSNNSGVPGFSDYATVAYDARTGDRLWVSSYNAGVGSYVNVANSLAVSPDGSAVFVTGYSESDAGYNDYATIAYDAASGDSRWVARFDGVDHASDEARSIGVSPDGSKVFVTGYSDLGIHADYVTLAYDAITGTESWRARLHYAKDDYANALGVSPDGTRLWVTGYARSPPGGYDYTTVGYDTSTGAELEQLKYNGVGTKEDLALALALSPDGTRLLVTGESDGGPSDFDYATVAYEV